MKNLILITLLSFTACAPSTDYPGQLDPQDGVQGVTGNTGAQGAMGATGAQGLQGLPGQSCSVTQNNLGALITCPDGTSALVLHGKQPSTCGHKKSKHNHHHED